MFQNEFAYSIADALSLGTERSGTKFAINRSLSTDVPLQSAIKIAKFILSNIIPKRDIKYREQIWMAGEEKENYERTDESDSYRNCEGGKRKRYDH